MTDRAKVIKGFTCCEIDASCANCPYFDSNTCIADLRNDVFELLKEQPEQKHGHWVFDPDGMDWNIPAWKCSECHCKNDNIPPNLERTNPLRWSGSKYCPNCGAKMDGEVKQNE